MRSRQSSVEDREDHNVFRRAGAEAVGTFALVFAGCGAIIVDASTGGVVGHGGVAAVFGLVIAVMVYATGHISGAHFNPAVTIAFGATGHFAWRDAPVYIGAQCAAAIAAAALLESTICGGPVATACANLGATVPAGSVQQALVLEVVLTFFLMFVITAVATDARAPRQTAGLAIGSTVALGALFGGPVSGASMNPARSLGPALMSGETTSLWIYIVAPILGAILGAMVYRAVR